MLDDEEDAAYGESDVDNDESRSDVDATAAALRPGRRRRLPDLPRAVDAALWQQECERLAPQLAVRLTWQQLGWRHRLAISQTHAPAVAVAAPAVQAPLEKLANHRQSGLEAVAPLREKHEREQAELEEVSAQASGAQQRVDALSIELVEITEAIERAKQNTASKGSELGGTAPLEKLRAALKALRSEVKSLTLREAFVSQQLASRRAANAMRDTLRRP